MLDFTVRHFLFLTLMGKTVLVGVAAVEFYAVGNYTTRDINLVSTHPDNIEDAMT